MSNLDIRKIVIVCPAHLACIKIFVGSATNSSPWTTSEVARDGRQQAERWLEKSRNRYGEAEVGTTVLLAIPDVDKGRCELPNLKCVVLEKTGGGMYR